MAWLAAFLVAVAIDYVVARWTREVTGERIALACLYSAVCSLLGFMNLLVCLDHWDAILPTALGHAVGTGLAMTRWRK